MTGLMEVLGVFGGAVAVVVALSAWIGKLWADRILSRENSEHQHRLTALESSLRHKVDAQLAQVNLELSTLKEKSLKAHADKLACYGYAIDSVAKLLAEFSAFVYKVPGARSFDEAFIEFDAARIRAYGHMALVAPQPVMTAYDTLVDYCIAIRNKPEAADWKKGRELALAWINAARADMGVDPTPVRYEGAF